MQKMKREGTPEEHLAHRQGEIDIDAVNCAINRAKAVTNLLYCNFAAKEGQKISTESAAEAIDAIDGYLDQIKILINEA